MQSLLLITPFRPSFVLATEYRINIVKSSCILSMRNKVWEGFGLSVAAQIRVLVFRGCVCK